MKQIIQKKLSGFSLIEVILAVGLFGLFSTALIGLLLSTYGGSLQASDRNSATLYAQQGIEAVWSIRRQGWNLMDNGNHGLTNAGSRWSFSGTSDILDSKFTRVVTIEDACRDISSNIVDCLAPGATVDLRTKKATVSVSYVSFLGINNEISLVSYLTFWQNKRWLQTDWFGGSGQNVWSDATRYESDDGNINFSSTGEIKLAGNMGGGCGVKNWSFDLAGDYIYDSNKIEVTGGLAQLKTSAVSGATANNTFDANAGSWVYYDWSQDVGDPDATGTWYGTGGNPNGFVDVNLPSNLRNKILGGYWQQAITTSAASPTALCEIDWEAITVTLPSGGTDDLYVAIYLETAAGAPSTVPVLQKNFSAAFGWESHSGANGVDCSAKFTAAGTYYYKIAVYVDAKNQDTGPIRVGFDNAKVSWSQVGGYPTDSPPINPTLSHSVGAVEAWASFYEAATKNGGEIYYQLSADDGTTWQYWSGSAWATAGAGNYNPAGIINANIGTFATSTKKIMFKAYLASNGSQAISLDQVSIGCSKTFDWPFTNAVDYSFDSNKIEFVSGLAQLKGTSQPSGPVSTSTDDGFNNIDWHFDASADYTYDSNKIEVADSYGQLKMTVTGSGATANNTFDANAGSWVYYDWSQDVGDPDATGTWYGTGGNPNGFIDVNLPSNIKNKILGGYWQQAITTSAASPTALCEIDWEALAVTLPNAGVDSLYVAIYVESASGAPSTVPVLQKDFTATFGWESHSGANGVDCSAKFTAAGTYYYKIAVYLDAKNQNTGPIRVGFDNAKVSWQKQSYPFDSPTIYPVDTAIFTGVTQWTSFTETAVKNGGEIYYQLSNDDGATWRYWTGAAWANATLATQYNTAAVINTNIGTFGVINQQIKFRAFLVSDGSQYVRLDRIVVGFTPTLGEWSFSTWGVDAGEVTPTGSNVNTGGNPKRWVDINIPAGSGDQVGGYWAQQFTVPYNNALVKVYFDYQVATYNPTPVTFKIYAFVDTTSGAPTLGEQVWSSPEITATQGWTTISGIDASARVPASGTYYFKLAAWVETPPAVTGPFRVGFDNAYVTWQAYSGVYPTDGPSVRPLTSLTIANLDTWSSFAETAQKSGGEIYYQLSDDDGSTWQYWNGSAWGTAGATNYNPASVVSSYIGYFSTTTGKIMFNAFLVGNSTQQVKIDNVRVGWGEAGGGGSGYAPLGYFTSSAFNMGTTSAMSIIEWDQTIPSCSPACEVKLQVRTAPDNGGVPGPWTGWYGATGLDTYFTQNTGSIINPFLNYNSWVQYRAELISDTVDTPSIQEIRIDYLP